MWSHTVAILIGGQSKRMGSPKHLVELPNGQTMLEKMLEFAHETAKNVVIVGGDVDGYVSIHDHREQFGPVAGIEAILMSNIDEKYLVVGCDMPLLEPKDVEQLIQSTTNSVFAIDDKIIGLPLCVDADVLPVCTAYLDTGGRSIRGFIEEIPHVKLEFSVSREHALSSMNSRDDINVRFNN
jgi:molybdopterin-guanine dinucleotide biosynthesis protein A